MGRRMNDDVLWSIPETERKPCRLYNRCLYEKVKKKEDWFVVKPITISPCLSLSIYRYTMTIQEHHTSSPHPTLPRSSPLGRSRWRKTTCPVAAKELLARQTQCTSSTTTTLCLEVILFCLPTLPFVSNTIMNEEQIHAALSRCTSCCPYLTISRVPVYTSSAPYGTFRSRETKNVLLSLCSVEDATGMNDDEGTRDRQKMYLILDLGTCYFETNRGKYSSRDPSSFPNGIGDSLEICLASLFSVGKHMRLIGSLPFPLMALVYAMWIRQLRLDRRLVLGKLFWDLLMCEKDMVEKKTRKTKEGSSSSFLVFRCPYIQDGWGLAVESLLVSPSWKAVEDTDRASYWARNTIDDPRCLLPQDRIGWNSAVRNLFQNLLYYVPGWVQETNPKIQYRSSEWSWPEASRFPHAMNPALWISPLPPFSIALWVRIHNYNPQTYRPYHDNDIIESRYLFYVSSSSPLHAIQQGVVEWSYPRSPSPHRFVGLEDIRTFSWKNECWFVATSCDVDRKDPWPTQYPHMVLGHWDTDRPRSTEIFSLHSYHGEGCEKNWMPWVPSPSEEGPLFFIYRVYPWTVLQYCSSENNRVESFYESKDSSVEESSALFRMLSSLRGSGPLLPFPLSPCVDSETNRGGRRTSAWLGCCHQVAAGSPRRYLHRFFVWTPATGSLLVSQPFRLDTSLAVSSSTEYLMQLAFDPTNSEVWMTYGINDKEAFAVSCSLVSFSEFLDKRMQDGISLSLSPLVWEKEQKRGPQLPVENVVRCPPPVSVRFPPHPVPFLFWIHRSTDTMRGDHFRSHWIETNGVPEDLLQMVEAVDADRPLPWILPLYPKTAPSSSSHQNQRTHALVMSHATAWIHALSRLEPTSQEWVVILEDDACLDFHPYWTFDGSLHTFLDSFFQRDPRLGLLHLSYSMPREEIKENATQYRARGTSRWDRRYLLTDSIFYSTTVAYAIRLSAARKVVNEWFLHYPFPKIDVSDRDCFEQVRKAGWKAQAVFPPLFTCSLLPSLLHRDHESYERECQQGILELCYS